MEELIKEAESLYKQINEVQQGLVFNRMNKDQGGINYSHCKMEDICCDVLQFLKCIIDRKDNIVDLGEVWHDIAEPADRNGHVLLSNHPKYIEMASQGQKIWGESICKGAKYAYLKDLLPKGGEAWNTTK